MAQNTLGHNHCDAKAFMLMVLDALKLKPHEVIPITRHRAAGGGTQVEAWAEEHVDIPMPEALSGYFGGFNGPGPYTHYSCSVQPKPTTVGLSWKIESALWPWVLVMDDVGTKVSPHAVQPSYRIETSPGNEQWGYLLHRPEEGHALENMVLARAAIRWMVEQGLTDESGSNAVRLARLPGMRPLNKEHPAKLVEWSGEVFDLETVTEQFGWEKGIGPIGLQAEARQALAQADAQARWWFQNLTDPQKLACAREMVAALPLQQSVVRDKWRKVGTALRSQGALLLPVFTEFSQKAGNYNPEVDDRLFETGKIGDQIGIGSLIYLAREYGWKPGKWTLAARQNVSLRHRAAMATYVGEDN